MRAFAASLLLAATVACGSRQIEVKTGATPASAATVTINNTLAKAVNVSVVSGGTDLFLRQVAANSTETVPVQGVASGSVVTLKAVTVDGANTYTRDNVTLGGTFTWQVP